MGRNIGQGKDYAHIHMKHQEQKDTEIYLWQTYSTPTMLSQLVTHSTTIPIHPQNKFLPVGWQSYNSICTTHFITCFGPQHCPSVGLQLVNNMLRNLVNKVPTVFTCYLPSPTYMYVLSYCFILLFTTSCSWIVKSWASGFQNIFLVLCCPEDSTLLFVTEDSSLQFVCLFLLHMQVQISLQ
jgi:hypothetical protein